MAASISSRDDVTGMQAAMDNLTSMEANGSLFSSNSLDFCIDCASTERIRAELLDTEAFYESIAHEIQADNFLHAPLAGPGFQFARNAEGKVVINSILAGGSADCDGKIQIGDEIVAVDGVDCKDLIARHIKQLILGPKDSTVSLTVNLPRWLNSDSSSNRDSESYVTASSIQSEKLRVGDADGSALVLTPLKQRSFATQEDDISSDSSSCYYSQYDGIDEGQRYMSKNFDSLRLQGCMEENKQLRSILTELARLNSSFRCLTSDMDAAMKDIFDEMNHLHLKDKEREEEEERARATAQQEEEEMRMLIQHELLCCEDALLAHDKIVQQMQSHLQACELELAQLRSEKERRQEEDKWMRQEEVKEKKTEDEKERKEEESEQRMEEAKRMEKLLVQSLELEETTRQVRRMFAEEAANRSVIEHLQAKLRDARQERARNGEQLERAKERLLEMERQVKALDLPSSLADLGEALRVEVERRRDEEGEAANAERIAQQAARMVLSEIVSSELTRMTMELREVEEEARLVLGSFESLLSGRTQESMEKSWILSLSQVANMSKMLKDANKEASIDIQTPAAMSSSEEIRQLPAPAPAASTLAAWTPAAPISSHLPLEDITELRSMADAMAVELQEVVDEMVYDSKHAAAILRNLEEEKKCLLTALERFYKLPNPVGVGIIVGIRSSRPSVQIPLTISHGAEDWSKALGSAVGNVIGSALTGKQVSVMEQEVFVVERLVPNLSAAMSGMVPVGAEILQIDQKETRGRSLKAVQEMLFGERGSLVRLQLRLGQKVSVIILKRGEGNLFDCDVAMENKLTASLGMFRRLHDKTILHVETFAMSILRVMLFEQILSFLDHHALCRLSSVSVGMYCFSHHTDCYSDILFEPWMNANMAIDPSWLTVENVDRRSGLTAQEFVENYEKRNLPVILTDVIPKWPASESWKCENLLKKYADTKFRVSATMDMKLEDFLDYCNHAREERPL
ncbi:hypothetical protein GUITHDRAFT_103933 [Guillardia theta CCMP2712]|uniref:PDZ domain-containing protein n=3 Tax=Guillardia theta TaxID=55529 RepID=L1JPW6_GUITC|nr:hypothetical protein GUITHDRAFT_103933 [Guillardia theta CCMP2712]EKX50118.1 hypothetical protein GUITHDRAFT_103933 [Guillardia theta CCMP2712]|eukprot:XP_005837098.1 hypothetical protein GUITHDRAFT_103933 [Guillardia theta CCMP2712]